MFVWVVVLWVLGGVEFVVVVVVLFVLFVYGVLPLG